MPTAIILLMTLIALNAFFAASEIALISLNDNKIRVMAEKGNVKAQLLLNLLHEPSRFLATIQIGITLAGFMASAFAAENFSARLVGLFKQTGIALPDSILTTISVVIITIILSYFTLVLGELVPKRLAMKKAEPLSMLVARPLTLLAIVTAPFVTLLTLSTNFFVRLFGVNPHEEDDSVTEEEIRMMVDVGEEKGTIHKNEKEMIINVFEFDNKTVADIMTHRIDIVAISVDATLQDVIALMREEKFSRIPIYQEHIDNIIGILITKDLIEYLALNGDNREFHLPAIMREAPYVPLSKRTDQLFKEMRLSQTHMVVIIDEYGGTAGIVTIEDLVEEIVGSILDEHDEEDKEIEMLDESTYLMNGSVSLTLVQDYLDLTLPVDQYDTLGGFVIGLLGTYPQAGESPAVEFANYIFTVVEVDKKRITKLKVHST